MLTIAQRAGGSAPTSAPSPLLLDTFPDAVPTNITSRPMTVGGNWTARAGTWLASGGQAHDSTSGVQQTVVADALRADATMMCPITLGNDTGLVCREVDANNYLLVRLTANTVELFTNIAGAFTGTGPIAVAWAGGQSHILTVQCAGTTITMSVDGVVVGTKTTAQFQTATRFGLRSFNDTATTFGVFTVSP